MWGVELMSLASLSVLGTGEPENWKQEESWDITVHWCATELFFSLFGYLHIFLLSFSVISKRN